MYRIAIFFSIVDVLCYLEGFYSFFFSIRVSLARWRGEIGALYNNTLAFSNILIFYLILSLPWGSIFCRLHFIKLQHVIVSLLFNEKSGNCTDLVHFRNPNPKQKNSRIIFFYIFITPTKISHTPEWSPIWTTTQTCLKIFLYFLEKTFTLVWRKVLTRLSEKQKEKNQVKIVFHNYQKAHNFLYRGTIFLWFHTKKIR